MKANKILNKLNRTYKGSYKHENQSVTQLNIPFICTDIAMSNVRQHTYTFFKYRLDVSIGLNFFGPSANSFENRIDILK